MLFMAITPLWTVLAQSHAPQSLGSGACTGPAVPASNPGPSRAQTPGCPPLMAAVSLKGRDFSFWGLILKNRI